MSSTDTQAADTAVETPTPAPAPVRKAVTPAPATPARPAFDEIVEAWWNDHFPGSPVGRVTEAWNHAYAAKEDLKQRLAESVK